MIIRKIAPKDNFQMANIIRDSLLEFNAAKPGTVFYDDTTDNLSELFKTKRSGYYVVEINKQIVGGGGFYPTKGLPDNVCELVKMYISKDFRRGGRGSKLLRKCMDAAIKQGYQKMYLESMRELNLAISMYEKNGFNHIPKPLGNSGHTGCDIWMMRDLLEI